MDPVLKIVVDIENAQKVQELKANVGALTMQILALSAQMKAGTLNTQQFTAAAMPMATQIKAAADQMKALEGAAASGGRGLGQLAYAIDDIQYGFNAIVNNIPQIVMGLGGSFGLAGAIGIAAVAINQLMKHWTELTSALQSSWSGGSAEQLRILAERAEKATEAFDKLKEAKGKWEEKAGKGLEETFVEGGVGDIQKRIADVMMAHGQAEPMRDIEEIASPMMKWMKEKTQGHRIPQNEVEQRQIQRDETAKKAAELMVNTQLPGQAGQNARDQLRGYVKQFPDAFTQEQQAGIMSNDPAQLKKQAEAEKGWETFRKGEDAIKKVREKDEEEVRKQVMKTIEAKKAGVAEEAKLKKEREHDEDAAEKRVHDAAKKRLDMERQKRIDAMEDKKDALQEQAHQLRLLHQASPKIFGSWKESLQDIQMGALEQVPKLQLRKLEDIHKGILELDKSIKGERRAARFG